MAYRHRWKKLQYSADYRLSNPRKLKKIAAGLRARNAAYIDDYKKTHPCVDCGITDPDVLQFDHIQGKKRRDVSSLASNTVSLSTLFREIAKCEVRCANCHQKVTKNRRSAARERRKAGMVIHHEACGAGPEQLSLFGSD